MANEPPKSPTPSPVPMPIGPGVVILPETHPAPTSTHKPPLGPVDQIKPAPPLPQPKHAN